MSERALLREREFAMTKLFCFLFLSIIMNPSVVDLMFRFNKSDYSIANHSLELYRNCLENVFTGYELKEYYRKGFHNIFVQKVDLESACLDVRDIKMTPRGDIQSGFGGGGGGGGGGGEGEIPDWLLLKSRI